MLPAVGAPGGAAALILLPGSPGTAGLVVEDTAPACFAITLGSLLILFVQPPARVAPWCTGLDI